MRIVQGQRGMVSVLCKVLLLALTLRKSFAYDHILSGTQGSYS